MIFDATTYDHCPRGPGLCPDVRSLSHKIDLWPHAQVKFCCLRACGTRDMVSGKLKSVMISLIDILINIFVGILVIFRDCLDFGTLINGNHHLFPSQ